MNNVSSSSREIVTFNKTSKKGVPYRWTGTRFPNTGLSQAIITALNKNYAGTVDTILVKTIKLGERFC